MLKGRVDRLAAEPEDTEALVEAVTLYHMVIEGMLALTGQHFIMDYNEREGHAAGLRRGLPERRPRRAPPRRLRRPSSCARRRSEDDRYSEAIQRTLEEALPVADGVLDPPWAEEDDWEMFGYSLDETHAFAAQCLIAAAQGDRPGLGR